MKLLMGEAKKVMASAISSGWPMRIRPVRSISWKMGESRGRPFPTLCSNGVEMYLQE